MLRIACLIVVYTNVFSLATSGSPGGGYADGIARAEEPESFLPSGRSGGSDSRFEQIEMKDHTLYSGLIESEDGDWLTIIRIQTPRGQKMHLVIQPLDRRDVVHVSHLSAARREALAKKIEEFRNRASIEAVRMEAIQLGTLSGEGNTYRHYQGEWFTLDSTADEPSTRRMIMRAEQIFAAYRQILPPREKPPHPPRLIVLGSMEQYRSLLAVLGWKTAIENPACYLEDKNVVAIGSDLARLARDSRQIIEENSQLRQTLELLQGRLDQRLRAVAANFRQNGLSDSEIARESIREREKFKKQLEKKREELRLSDQKIEYLFKRTTSQTLVRLYHESFHAYLRNNVYPRQKYDVPPWLNEGLAVIFEGGQLEGNTLRVDAPNPLALKKLKADLAGPSPLTLRELLAAGESQFLLTAAVPPAAVDRYYVHAWGVAYYLTFEKHLLGGPALEKYLQAGNARLDPVQRFVQLIGMPLDRFEREWRAYIQAL
jgi:regulator of replication initiation timing